MAFDITHESGRPVKIKDEGVTVTNNVSSIDFVGAGIASTGSGDDVTATVAGTGTVSSFSFTNGGGFTGTVATATSTPALSLTLQNASASQAGQLSASDFSTFNSKGDALTTDPLSQFASTTSAQLASIISNETGTGLLVFATSPTLTTPLLGTPTSGVLTNCTGLPASSVVAGSFGAGAYVISTSLQVVTIELGHATDTTLARVSAGVISVEGNTIYAATGTDVVLADGGTSASLVASNGGIVYSTATAMAILAGTTAGKALLSGATTTPVWSTPTYPSASGGAGTVLRSDGTNNVYSTFTIPDTMAINTILYASAANVISALATAASGVLVTGAGAGVPSISTDIPTAVTIGAAYIYRAGGTDVAVADGGTGGSIASITLFNNITGYTASGSTGTTSTALVFSTSPALTTPTFVTSIVGDATFALCNTVTTTLNFAGAATTLNIGAAATCILNFGGSTTASEFRFLEPSGSGTNYSAFKAVAQAASITYSLPPAVGAAGTFLKDAAGDGVLTWAAAGGSSPSLIATTLAGSGSISGAGASQSRFDNGIPTVNFANGQVAAWDATFVVPVGATSISSIKIFHFRRSTGNMYLKFFTRKINMDAAGAYESDSTDTLTTYTGTGSDSAVEIITVPAAAYNALTNIDVDDVIGIYIYRDSVNATDTYEDTMYILGAQITFA